MMRQGGPAALWLVRHGESTGNVAREDAESGGAEVIDIAERDADVPLSELGAEQARAVGRWLSGLPADRRPTVAMSSPYLRALDTARTALDELDEVPLIVDERLRDRVLGVLDLLTASGVVARYPEEAARRRRLGKFYHRPAGGESWADVALRLRSLLGDIKADYPGHRVVLFAHEALVFLTRYVVERLSEQDLMAMARSTELANCSLTAYERGPAGDLQLVSFNVVDMLPQHGVPPTVEPGVRVEPA